MTKRELKNQIIASYSCASDSPLDSIKLSCANIIQESEMPEFLVPQKRSRFYGLHIQQMAMALAVAVLVLLCSHLAGTLIHRQSTPATPSTIVGTAVTDIFIDVNPSIEVTLDENNLVVECNAVNSDAEKIVKDLDLKGTKFSVAFSAIVGTLYMNGYLQGDTDAMLVSVDTSRPEVMDEISKELETVFRNNSLSSSILVQPVEKDKVIDQATENGISSGKMELIDRIVEKSEEYADTDIKELAERNIRFLTDLLNSLLKPEGGNDENGNKPDNGDNTSQTPDNPVQGVVEDITGAAGDIIGDVTENAGQVVDDTLNEVDKTVDSALDSADKVVDSALDTADKAVDDALDTAEEAVDNALDTASKVVDSIVNAITGLFKHH